MNRIVLHIDMNSYFASVEQQANPFLRGKAVGVCAYLSPNGCIIASSREAKAKGIKTGCRVSDAKKLDPKVVLVENEPAKYRSTTEKIFALLAEYTGALEPYSIDEAFLDLTGWVKNFDAAEKIAREMKRRIKEEIGEWLECSIGISYTKFLAKFAGDIAPKGGILIIDKKNLAGILAGRDLKDAWGINKAMERRLNVLGIHDLLELKNHDPYRIKRELGSYGYYLWANVNGKEISRVASEESLPKSIGHSYCIPRRTNEKAYLIKIIHKLCEKTGRRLRKHELEAQKINFYAGYVHYFSGGEGGKSGYGSETRQITASGGKSLNNLAGDKRNYGSPAEKKTASNGWSRPSAGGLHKLFTPGDKIFITEEIFNPIHDFILKADILLPVSILAVSVTRLSPISGQASLFYDNLKARNVSRAMDKLNDKYGEYTVVRGSMFNSEDLARDRIGFRKTVSFKEV